MDIEGIIEKCQSEATMKIARYERCLRRSKVFPSLRHISQLLRCLKAFIEVPMGEEQRVVHREIFQSIRKLHIH